MSVIQAIILGIIQGLSEFLPVSSSGHLVLFQKLFGLNEGTLTFSIVLHVGTLIPVLIVFRKEIFALLKNPFQKTTYLLVLATIPAVLAALFLDDYIEKLFNGGSFLALGFFITGLLLLYADTANVGRKTEKEMSYTDGLIIGVIQACAITPAVSRSGSTITAGLFRGLSRETAARFSFLLSIPAIAGATVLELKKIVTGEVSVEGFELLPTVFGFLAAVISGYFAISFMLKLIKACKLKYFSYYVFALSALILVDQFITKIFF